MATKRPTGINAPNGDIWEFQDAKVGDLTQTGVTGATVAAQISQLNDEIDVVTGYSVMDSAIQALNLDNITSRQSIIYTNANSTNKPSGAAWGLVITFNFDTNTAFQLYLSATDSKAYSRSKSGGTWHSWLTLSN